MGTISEEMSSCSCGLLRGSATAHVELHTRALVITFVTHPSVASRYASPASRGFIDAASAAHPPGIYASSESLRFGDRASDSPLERSIAFFF